MLAEQQVIPAQEVRHSEARLGLRRPLLLLSLLPSPMFVTAIIADGRQLASGSSFINGLANPIIHTLDIFGCIYAAHAFYEMICRAILGKTLKRLQNRTETLDF
jgi:hypothetical protein